jgi:hypothetical protein
MRFMSMKKKSFAKRNGKILEATDINLVTDEVLKEQLEYGKDLISYRQIFRAKW